MNTKIRTMRLTDDEWEKMRTTALGCGFSDRTAWVTALLVSEKALKLVEQCLKENGDD